MKTLSVIFIVLVICIGAYLLYMRFSYQQEVVVGGQKDEHGCLIAAGYSWCAPRAECERSWERYCTTALPIPAQFTCDNGKSIDAVFYPKDDKFVDLILSDDRAISLPHATSASGARYARSDESIVFWNKGDTAFITENGRTTFANCILLGK